MANVPSEADRLLEAGHRIIRLACLFGGGPLLAIVVLAGLHGAGAVRLEEYIAADPDNADPRMIWLVLGGLALLPFLFLAMGLLIGWAMIRGAKHLRQQPAPGRSKGISGQAR